MDNVLYKRDNFIFVVAQEKDREDIRDLFKSVFGMMTENCHAADEDLSQYILVKDTTNNFKIVAISGIAPPALSVYDGYEITWTCTDPDYRKQGLVSEILKISEKLLPDDGLPIYCECWHIRDKKYPNIYGVIKKLGFHLMENAIRTCNIGSPDCVGCSFSSKECFCSTDLYVKEKHTK